MKHCNTTPISNAGLAVLQIFNDTTLSARISCFFDNYRLFYYYYSLMNINFQKLIKLHKFLSSNSEKWQKVADLFPGSKELVKDSI